MGRYCLCGRTPVLNESFWIGTFLLHLRLDEYSKGAARHAFWVARNRTEMNHLLRERQSPLSGPAPCQTRGNARQSPEMPRQVALVREACCQGDLRQGQLRLTKHLFHMLHPAPQQVPMWRHAHRLLEGARKVIERKPCHRGQSAQTDFLADMFFNEIANAVF